MNITIDGIEFEETDNIYPISNGVWYQNKWYIPKKKEELCVPVGTKFTTKYHSKYCIEKVVNDLVTISWNFDGGGSTTYPIKQVNANFKDGTWIEYKEKEWKILTLEPTESYKENYEILNDKSNINAWLEGFCKERWTIGSVKRLSDGEIFKLEDRTNSGIIKEIQWYNNTPYVIYTNGSRFSPLNTWKKLKDPLFTKAQKEEIIEIIKEEYKC